MSGPPIPDPAPRGRRIGGRVVDGVVAGWLLAVAAIEIDGRLLGGDVFARRPLAAVAPHGGHLAVIVVLVLLVLEILPTARWGSTPGKAMLGLRCVDIETGEPPGVLRSVLRGLVLHAWVAVPWVGWTIPLAVAVTTLAAPTGRGVHDRLVGTVVVDVAPRREAIAGESGLEPS